MAKTIKADKPKKTVRILIDLPQDIVERLQRISDEQMRDRKTQIQKILIDYAKDNDPG